MKTGLIKPFELLSFLLSKHKIHNELIGNQSQLDFYIRDYIFKCGQKFTLNVFFTKIQAQLLLFVLRLLSFRAPSLRQ